MRPSDEVSVITAGVVIAELFRLLDRDGGVAAELDNTPTAYPPDNPWAAIAMLDSNSPERVGRLAWGYPWYSGAGIDAIRLDLMDDGDTEHYGAYDVRCYFDGTGDRTDLSLEAGADADTTARSTLVAAQSTGSEIRHTATDGSEVGLLTIGAASAFGVSYITATADYVTGFVPIGSIVWTVASSPDPGWIFMTGNTITDAQTDYPALWAKAPTAWRSGANLVLPDTRGRVFVVQNTGDTDFDVIGETRGSKTHTLTTSEMPSHNHPGTSASTSVSITNTDFVRSFGGGDAKLYSQTAHPTFSGYGPYNTGGASATASTSVTVASQGGGGAHNNIQPSVVFCAMLHIGMAG